VRAELLPAPHGESRTEGARYEIVDAKLARSAKGRAVAQTVLYSQLLADLQGGIVPRRLHLALGTGELASLKVNDFAAPLIRGFWVEPQAPQPALTCCSLARSPLLRRYGRRLATLRVAARVRGLSPQVRSASVWPGGGWPGKQPGGLRLGAPRLRVTVVAPRVNLPQGCRGKGPKQLSGISSQQGPADPGAGEHPEPVVLDGVADEQPGFRGCDRAGVGTAHGIGDGLRFGRQLRITGQAGTLADVVEDGRPHLAGGQTSETPTGAHVLQFCMQALGQADDGVLAGALRAGHRSAEQAADGGDIDHVPAVGILSSSGTKVRTLCGARPTG
jgi:hypothetical protein